MEFKNNYSTGDRVSTPLGDATIVDWVEIRNEMHPIIKLDHTDNPDGDTFPLTTFGFKHIED